MLIFGEVKKYKISFWGVYDLNVINQINIPKDWLTIFYLFVYFLTKEDNSNLRISKYQVFNVKIINVNIKRNILTIFHLYLW